MYRPLRLSLLATVTAAALTFTPSPTFAQAHTPLIEPIPGTIPASGITVALETLMTGLVQPTAGAIAPSDPDHLYIADQIGKVWALDTSRHNKGATRLFLDISGKLVVLGLGPSKYDERGLLGIAFHPGFRHNRLFYTFSSEPVSGPATFSTLPVGVAANCQNVLREWQVQDTGDDTFTVDPGSAREILRIDKPQFNHNGGAIIFGPDRLMYLSVGDGGGSNDFGVGHAAIGNAQTLAVGNIYGKILRIDPLGRNSANGQYGIPYDNPFSSRVNPLPGSHEVYAYGFRNPWRMSFDLKTDKLYAGDVGQNDIEEIDAVRKGMNYGWPIKEGTFLFDGFLPGRGGAGYVWQNSPGSPAGLVDPIAQYDHSDTRTVLHSAPSLRQAVIGGFVYRGDEIDALRGKYIFGDYGSATTPIEGVLLVQRGPGRPVQTLAVEGRTALGLAVLGFTQGRDGELYLLASQTGTVLGTTGVVMRIKESAEDRRHDRDHRDRDHDDRGGHDRDDHDRDGHGDRGDDGDY